MDNTSAADNTIIQTAQSPERIKLIIIFLLINSASLFIGLIIGLEKAPGALFSALIDVIFAVLLIRKKTWPLRWISIRLITGILYTILYALKSLDPFFLIMNLLYLLPLLYLVNSKKSSLKLIRIIIPVSISFLLYVIGFFYFLAHGNI